jgi:hypothetical protein
MLGDSIVYGFSLDVVARGAVWQARVALLKGLIMAAFGIGVLAQVGDVNMRSAWVCSLNDEGGNAAVLWPALPSRSRVPVELTSSWGW